MEQGQREVGCRAEVGGQAEPCRGPMAPRSWLAVAQNSRLVRKFKIFSRWSLQNLPVACKSSPGKKWSNDSHRLLSLSG